MPDTSIRTYRAKRDFTVTSEPQPEAAGSAGRGMFVVQKHAAQRAGLHWDFRLEHGGVLWSWAVPKGPSLDPGDRRMAIHVEDHPIEYAAFQGTIPDGQYGAGTVSTWDTGSWEPLDDPESGMAKGHLHFLLHGGRLHGRFSLVRSGRRDPRKPEAWFLIKSEDEHARPGHDATRLEQAPTTERPAAAVRGVLPEQQEPQLCALAEVAPAGAEWLSEIKFDGYRILASLDHGVVRLLTRSGLDWAERMPRLAAAFAGLPVQRALLDGELVALQPDGTSSFPALQAALKNGRDDLLTFYGFDLLHLDGWDYRPAPLRERKAALQALPIWTAPLRFSDHVPGPPAELHANACRMGLEGIVCKRADAPYRPGRGRDWLKVKCSGREELVVLGWTPPAGGRKGLGSLQLGYWDPGGQLHFAGGVGTGFTQDVLLALRRRLDTMAAPAPQMLVSGDPVDPGVQWVRPELVVEVKYATWSGAGRVRHAVFLGLREDKPAREVIREVADAEAERTAFKPRSGAARRFHGAIPPMPKPVPDPAPTARKSSRIVTAKKPQPAKALIGHVELSHPDRPLWPGITKQDLAAYWEQVAPHALPGLAARPLSIVRCPDGIGGEQFFQKNGHGFLPRQIREGTATRQPFLAIDDTDGLFAMAQMSAIELHAWGAPETDPTRPDTLVFDLDPGEGVAFKQVVAAAHEVRARLLKLGLRSLCRTTGGKGLHVVVPLDPAGGAWDVAKPFCRAFAETMAQDDPARYVAHLKIADRGGKILVDWLRNGLGATAVASFSPRARPGAGVATPLDWAEVVPKLDPGAFTLHTVPKRLATLKADPWAERAGWAQRLPDLKAPAKATPAAPTAAPAPRGPSKIVVARKPRKA